MSVSAKLEISRNEYSQQWLTEQRNGVILLSLIAGSVYPTLAFANSRFFGIAFTDAGISATEMFDFLTLKIFFTVVLEVIYTHAYMHIYLYFYFSFLKI